MNHENAEFGRKAQERSPLFMPIARRDGKIHLFAGLNDGYSGSVPISHSILFWNRLCRDYGYTEDIFALEDIIALLTKGILPLKGKGIGGRNVFAHKTNSVGSITVFEGGHEILVEYCFEMIKADAVNSKSPIKVDK